MAESEKHFEMAVDLARDALRGLLLVNGGAATALIALMDKSGGRHDYTFAILWFAAGSVAAVISSLLGYFSQLYYANHRTSNNTRMHALHLRWQTAAILAVIVTLGFMIAGIISAALAAH
jgi:type III secretory pathway component EscT